MNDLNKNRPERVYQASNSHGISQFYAKQTQTDRLKTVITIPAPLRGRTFSVTLAANKAQKVITSDEKRRGLFIQNLSANDVYVAVGTSVGNSLSDAILIPANTAFEFPSMAAPTNDVYARSTAESNIVIIESTLV